MAEPKRPADEKAAPSFPAPRRQQEPSPYRKGAAPAGPEAPVSSKPMVVSRPEPPPPAVSPPKQAPRKVSPPARMDIDPPGYDKPRIDPGLARLIARFPRGVAAVVSFLSFAAMESAASSDRRAIAEAFLQGKEYAYVTKPYHFVMYAAIGGPGLWVLLTGIPIDDKTGRPPDWWFLGLIGFAIASIALREQVMALLVRVF